MVTLDGSGLKQEPTLILPKVSGEVTPRNLGNLQERFEVHYLEYLVSKIKTAVITSKELFDSAREAAKVFHASH